MINEMAAHDFRSFFTDAAGPLQQRVAALLGAVMFTAALLLSHSTLALDISGELQEYPVTPSLFWLEDPTHKLTIERVKNVDTLQRFSRHQGNTFNRGYSPSNFWFYVPITLLANQEAETQSGPQSWLLTIDYPQLDSINIYLRRSGGEITQLHLGDSLAFEQRPYQARNYIVPLLLQEDETVELFMKINSESSIQLPVSLITSEGLIAKQLTRETIYGVYFGIMAVMILYNLFIYLSIRDSSYLFYIGYITAFALLQASVSGHAFAYLWPNSPGWNPYAVPLLAPLACFFGVQFSRRFLHSKQYAPITDKLLRLLAGLSLLSLAVGFVAPMSVAVGISVALIITSTIPIIIAAIICLKKGYHTARFFLLAWLCLLPGALIHALTAIDLTPTNAFTVNAGLIGSTLEVILLSLALADRINYLRQENQSLMESARLQLQKGNDELSSALNKVEQNNRLKDQFLATVSHELRTPMNGVEGSLALVGTDNLRQSQLGYIETAKTSAREMTSVIDSILRFSEIQSGQLKLKEESVEIRAELIACSVKFRRQCQQKNLGFSWHIDKNVPMYVEADSEQILLVLKHLIDNAIKFTQNGKVSVHIETIIDQQSDQEMLSYSVIDSGEGIAAEQHEAIFTAFQQLDGSDTRQHRGLGIGLAICRQLATIMGGSLQLQSKVSGGTIFTFNVPLRRSEKQSTVRIPARAEYVSRQKTILVAEDNPVNQLVLKGMLGNLNCMILTADNGMEVAQLLESQPVDLIMMDCQMPYMDGFETTRKIRSSNAAYSNVPIIAVTANALTSDSARCLSAGMNDYIKKPINRDIIESKVKRWLHQTELAAL